MCFSCRNVCAMKMMTGAAARPSGVGIRSIGDPRSRANQETRHGGVGCCAQRPLSLHQGMCEGDVSSYICSPQEDVAKLENYDAMRMASLT